MQNGISPAHEASYNGHTETLALLLANKADINVANKVQQFTIFKYLLVIGNELEDFDIAFFMCSTIIAHLNMNYYSTCFTLVFYAVRYYASGYSFPKWTH